MSNRLSKILAVTLLSLLIWTWAYMSQEKTRIFSGNLEVAPSVDESLLITFSLIDSNFKLTQVPLGTLNFKGPPSQISELVKKNTLPPNDPEREPLNYYYTPPAGQPEGTYTLDVLDYLQKHTKTHDLALSLESCKPEQVEVHVEELERKKLPIQVVDEDGLPLKGATVEPAFVLMYARTANNSAKVSLSDQQIISARKTPVSVTPYVEFDIADIVRYAEQPVRVSLSEEDRRKTQPYQPTSIGCIVSPSLTGKYTVDVLNESQLTSTTQFYATDEAMDAYKKMRHHILIEIRDGDELLPEIPPRPVIYNFPPDYFKAGDIDIVDTAPPKTAQVKLVPVHSNGTD